MLDVVRGQNYKMSDNLMIQVDALMIEVFYCTFTFLNKGLEPINKTTSL